VDRMMIFMTVIRMDIMTVMTMGLM
jgi:hypothetical protein